MYVKQLEQYLCDLEKKTQSNMTLTNDAQMNRKGFVRNVQNRKLSISAIRHTTQPLSALSTYEGIFGTEYPKLEVLRTIIKTSNSPKNSFNNPI